MKKKVLMTMLTGALLMGSVSPTLVRAEEITHSEDIVDAMAEDDNTNAVAETEAETENAVVMDDEQADVTDANAEADADGVSNTDLVVVENDDAEMNKGSIPTYYSGDENINGFIYDYKAFPNNKVNAMSGLMAYNISLRMGNSSYDASVWGLDIENEMGNIGYEAVKEKYGLDFLDDAQWISGFEGYFDEPAGTTPAMVLGLKPRPTDQTPSVTPAVTEAKLNGMCWIYQNDSVDVGVNFTTPSTAQFRWTTYNLDTQEWNTISDWSSSNWASWYGEKGNYWLRCEMRTVDGGATVSELTQCFAYTAGNTQISGTYAGYRSSDEILLGCSSATAGQGETYSFKIYNIDTGEWIYLTDKNPAQWVSWTPKNGNYWTHFELYTKDGRLADTKTYCFAVQGR